MTRARALLTAFRPIAARAFVPAIAVFGLACIVGGVALVYPPAGLVALGVVLLGAITFDPTAVRRLTWPR